MSDERLHREVEVLRAELEALRSKVEAPRRRTRWLPLGVGIALVSTFAWAQLVTFSPDAPARADEVNGNFNQLRTWLEQKVGAVGSNTITTGGIAIGAAGPTQVTLGGNGSGQLTVTGGLALAEGTGIASNRLAAVTSVVNLNTNNFSSGFLEGTFADPGGTIVIMVGHGLVQHRRAYRHAGARRRRAPGHHARVVQRHGQPHGVSSRLSSLEPQPAHGVWPDGESNRQARAAQLQQWVHLGARDHQR
ncbi:MAG: hypothetical protein Q8S33_08705 [Myxococcales bacterium]|nr:hypothetical protein [Myxococcales bacterium]